LPGQTLLCNSQDEKTVKEYSEKDLIRRLSEGDEKAFKFIFDQYYRPLTIFAMKYLGDMEESKEVVQNFFVRLWSRHHELQIRFSIKMYVYQSVRNACFNYLEANKVEKRHMQEYSRPLLTSENALENMIVAEQEEMLMSAIDRLPQRCREIFVLSRMNKLSNQAIATQLDISIKTVEAQISIALKRLMEGLMAFLIFLF
jgi:RNA polymerase sigma-70 factor (ECF subfamily)